MDPKSQKCMKRGKNKVFGPTIPVFSSLVYSIIYDISIPYHSAFRRQKLCLKKTLNYVRKIISSWKIFNILDGWWELLFSRAPGTKDLPNLMAASLRKRCCKSFKCFTTTATIGYSHITKIKV